MRTMTYTAARNKLARTINEVTRDHAPVVITRQKGEAAVLMSLDDYNAFEETAYLLRSPANAARLLKAAREAEKGKARKRKLVAGD
ncbi:MAG: type II toxin-antitoxin system prevent-host-death family antitoxin [Nitrospinae bacterium]|nr:type II toxin-antitoxin system prevent-host-death family antitoxin [Nitrospinota bacterium]